MNKAPDFKEERILWKRGFRFVAGLDEVGRGAWAGGVVASAVVWPRPLKLKIKNEKLKMIEEAGINDSKQLNPQQREKLAEFIKQNAIAWGIGEVGPRLINRLGVARATKMAFRRAIRECNLRIESRKLTVEFEIRSSKMENLRSTLQHQDLSSTFYHPSSKIDYLLIDAFYIPYIRGLPVGKHVRKGRRSADSRARQKAIIDGDQKSLSISAASILAKVHRDSLMQKLSKRYTKYRWGSNKGYGTKEHQKALLRYGLTPLHRRKFVETWQNKLKVQN